MNLNNKKLAAIIGTLTAGGLAAVAVVNITRADAGHSPDAPTRTRSADPSASQPIAVVVQEPEKRTLHRLLRMPATLRADEQVDLYAKTSGYVSAVKVDIGHRVGKGDVLIEIDVPEMHDELRQAEATVAARQARMESAKAKLNQADLRIQASLAEQNRYDTERHLKQVTYDRVARLHADQVVTDQAFDEAQSGLATADAQLKVAEANVASARGDRKAAQAEVREAQAAIALAEADVARIKTLMTYAVIQAPFDGVITDRHVDHGAFVRSAAESATTPLLTLAKDDRIRLTLQIPESDAPFVGVGTTVDVHVKTLKMHLEARVSRIASALEPGTGTMQTEVDLDNPERKLAPGMYAHVSVRLESKPSAMMIPSKAIRVRGGETLVYVANDRVAQALPIKVGYDDGIHAEVLSGLAGNEWVVVSSDSLVAPGTPINPVPAGEAAETAIGKKLDLTDKDKSGPDEKGRT